MKSPKKFSSSIFNVQSRKKEKSEETYGSIEELNEGLISNPIIPIVRSEIEDDGRSPPPQHIPVQKRNAQIEYDRKFSLILYRHTSIDFILLLIQYQIYLYSSF